MRHAMSALVKNSKSLQIVANAYASAAMRSYLRAALRENATSLMSMETITGGKNPVPNSPRKKAQEKLAV